jgi:hypothetical protein
VKGSLVGIRGLDFDVSKMGSHWSVLSIEVIIVNVDLKNTLTDLWRRENKE